jgi:hypothetical protein
LSNITGGPVLDRDAETTAADPPKRNGGNGPLERVTVNLIPRASRALQAVSELTGDTKTDSINRAIQIYAYLEEVAARGGTIHVRESADAEAEKLKIF